MLSGWLSIGSAVKFPPSVRLPWSIDQPPWQVKKLRWRKRRERRSLPWPLQWAYSCSWSLPCLQAISYTTPPTNSVSSPMPPPMCPNPGCKAWIGMGNFFGAQPMAERVGRWPVTKCPCIMVHGTVYDRRKEVLSRRYYVHPASIDRVPLLKWCCKQMHQSSTPCTRRKCSPNRSSCTTNFNPATGKGAYCIWSLRCFTGLVYISEAGRSLGGFSFLASKSNGVQRV